MFRIYVSSTYLDLVGERRAARDAIHGLGHYAVGMQNYSASDDRPLDRCLKDIRSCQAYVGIFAWRHGFRPGGGQKSITQLKYEEARLKGIPCFLFLLDENAPWPRIWVPGDEQPRIKALRAMLSAEHLVTYFRDATTFAHALTQSLANGMEKPTSPTVPEILPYLCDRSEQEFALREVTRRLNPKRPRPVAYVVHGEETETHDKFLERLQKIIIPLLLPKETAGCVLSYRLEWPGSVRSAADIHRRLEASLSKEVLASVVGTRQAVNIHLPRTSNDCDRVYSAASTVCLPPGCQAFCFSDSRDRPGWS
jgi:hypothetical protein